MKDKFSDIADTKFTAHMEQKLDSVEEGATPWKGVLRDFYGDFEEHLKKAEQDLEGTRIKVPDEVSEEICPECGRNLVVKSGRFGRFLACPGYPDCSFTMPLVVEMPGRCPKCGGRLMKRTGRNGTRRGQPLLPRPVERVRVPHTQRHTQPRHRLMVSGQRHCTHLPRGRKAEVLPHAAPLCAEWRNYWQKIYPRKWQ